MARVDNRDFVVAWATSRTLEDVIAGTGMTKAAVNSRAQFLRKKGVKLDRLQKPSNTRLDDFEIAQLNSLIKKYTKQV